jgi:hypothetical protein
VAGVLLCRCGAVAKLPKPRANCSLPDGTGVGELTVQDVTAMPEAGFEFPRGHDASVEESAHSGQAFPAVVGGEGALHGVRLHGSKTAKSGQDNVPRPVKPKYWLPPGTTPPSPPASVTP